VATILLPWYHSLSPRHQSELMLALFHTLTAPGVDRVLLVSEVPGPPLSHPRLEFVSAPRRPTFWDLFEVARGVGPFAICNADCGIIDARAIDTLRGDLCFWVTRWDVRYGAPLCHRYALSYGADLFAFPEVPERLERGPWAPGEVYCDRVLGRALSDANYLLSNPALGVPVVHFHHERVRVEDEMRPATGRYQAFAIKPTEHLRSPLWSEPFIERNP
jgi:hypothetical protein